MPKKYTETALTKIISDLLSNLGNTYGSILALLDYLLPSIQSTTTYSSNVYKKSVSSIWHLLG